MGAFRRLLELGLRMPVCSWIMMHRGCWNSPQPSAGRPGAGALSLGLGYRWVPSLDETDVAPTIAPKTESICLGRASREAPSLLPPRSWGSVPSHDVDSERAHLHRHSLALISRSPGSGSLFSRFFSLWILFPPKNPIPSLRERKKSLNKKKIVHEIRIPQLPLLTHIVQCGV